MVHVNLNIDEMMMGTIAGCRRRVESNAKSFPRQNIIGDKNYSWDTEIESCCAEVAFAKAYNLFFDFSCNTFKRPDVGGKQIRHTKYPNGRLILRPDDNEEQEFFLVTGLCPNFQVIGWILCKEGKKEEWYDDDRYNPTGPKPFWMVPQPFLTLVGDPEPLPDPEKVKEILECWAIVQPDTDFPFSSASS